MNWSARSSFSWHARVTLWCSAGSTADVAGQLACIGSEVQALDLSRITCQLPRGSRDPWEGMWQSFHKEAISAPFAVVEVSRADPRQPDGRLRRTAAEEQTAPSSPAPPPPGAGGLGREQHVGRRGGGVRLGVGDGQRQEAGGGVLQHGEGRAVDPDQRRLLFGHGVRVLLLTRQSSGHGRPDPFELFFQPARKYVKANTFSNRQKKEAEIACQRSQKTSD